MIVLLEHFDLSMTCKFKHKILPMMLALRLMVSGNYYAKNYADIISLGLANLLIRKVTIACYFK